MKNVHILLSLLFLSFSGSLDPGSPIDYVDPMIGTDGIGHTFPGATTPFGMVQLSPTMNRKGWNWCSGYHYSDSIIKGFAHNHLSGTGIAGLADILVMPMSGKLRVSPGEVNKVDGYKSTYSHEDESANAGYYEVRLKENKVKAELTATPRVGVHRYTFLASGDGHVVIDPTHTNVGRAKEAYVEVISETEIRGYKHEVGSGAGERKVYFYAVFNRPFAKSGVVDKEGVRAGSSYKGRAAKAFASFKTDAGMSVEVKVALSYVSQEGAQANYMAEAANLNFETAQKKAAALWADKLNKIEISTSSVRDKRIFYTGLYHAYISPNLISDVDGKFVVEGQVFQTDYPQYSNYSTWDTFRALHPLLTILEDDKVAEMVNSMSSRHSLSGLELPKWEMLGFDNRCMPGYSIVPVMAEAILKDIPGIDIDQAYASMKHAASGTAKHSPNYGGYNGMEEYLYDNYIPANVGSSVTKTTEYNYYDWCIGKVAEKLSYEEDAAFFYERSKMWMHYFNAENGYLWPKDISGDWVDLDFRDWEEPNKHYVSGNIWGYSSFVPHDMATLIALHGGTRKFVKWIDDVIADTTSIGGHQHVDLSGFIGKYGHGDEPSHQLPYLYNYAGQPWKTQELVPRIMNTFYDDTPNGLVNNEDMGQMSAWYVFSALGFYPVAPGSLQYIIGTPKYKEASIQLPKRQTFTVKAKRANTADQYIQKAWLNGRPFNRSYITHHELLEGGTLTFEMGSAPNTSWGSDPKSLPVQPVSAEHQFPKQKKAYAPFAVDEEGAFYEVKEVVLKTKEVDAMIYYTLDGSVPDAGAERYSGPFEITSSTELKAITYKKDLKPSPVFTKYYTKSIFPELSEGYPIITIKGGKIGRHSSTRISSLTDQVFGTTYFKDKKWTALQHGDNMIIELQLGEERVLNLLELSVLSDTRGRRLPPKHILVEEKTAEGWRVVTSRELPAVGKDELTTYQYQFELSAIKADHLKVTLENHGRVPRGLQAQGGKSVIFVDEVNVR